MTRGRVVLAVTAALLVVALGAVAGCTQTSEPTTGGGSGEILGDDVTGPLIDGITERTVKPLPTARLADGLIPPTNRWFSGLVFGDVSMPVFPLPLSFQLTEGGYAFGVPRVVASPNTIMGSFAGSISVDVGADSQLVTAYDEASITVTQYAGDVELGSTVIAQGSPFVSFTATSPVTVNADRGFAPTDGGWTAALEGVTYGLVTSGAVTSGATEVALAAGQIATWFALSDGGSFGSFAEAAASPLESTSLTYSVGEGDATTTISYETSAQSATIVAAMPHQLAGLAARDTDCGLGTFASVYGTLTACLVTDLSWSVPTVQPTGTLDLSGLGADESSALIAQLQIDIATTPTSPADTYYGGKWLYRLVNLYDMARQLGADDVATTLKVQLVQALNEWMDPAGCTTRDERCFVYDPAARGLVGLAPSFGSDEFNDHHFHYGYFLYTAGVLAADDPTLAQKWAPVMDLLAADIAAQGATANFPERRVFDAYSGHSWASGTSPFADGNNQESSSEAVSAWNGLALWAAASGNSPLQTEAVWMLSAEAASALAYATNFDIAESVYDGFDHTVASLNWGGKRDFATWFSAEPSAMLGIVVLPMSPVAGYLGDDPDRIRLNLAEAAPNGYDVLFGDYLLMYSALAGPEDAAVALAAARDLNEDRIDGGNSRSYLLAFIMSRA